MDDTPSFSEVEPWVDPDFPPSEASFGETFFREKAEKFGGSDKIVPWDERLMEGSFYSF